MAPDRPLSPSRSEHCQIEDNPWLTARHAATTNAAIVVVIDDILGRLAATFSTFCALSGRIFCSKIECVAWTAKFWNCAMARRTNMFWREIMGNSDDNDSVFEGFSRDNLVKVDSDLDIDFDALPSDSRLVIVKQMVGRATLSGPYCLERKTARRSSSQLFWTFCPVRKL